MRHHEKILVTPQEFLEAIRKYVVLYKAPCTVADRIANVPIYWCHGQPIRDADDYIHMLEGYHVDGETEGGVNPNTGVFRPYKVMIWDEGFRCQYPGDTGRLAYVLVHELAHVASSNIGERGGHGDEWAHIARTFGIDERPYRLKPDGCEGRWHWLDENFEAFARSYQIILP